MTDSKRALATVELITDIAPIPDADAIVRARIRGWDVVVKKDEFAPGDEVIYFEIDSFLPASDERFAFLAARGVRTQDGIEGHVLKTARLRGQYSQGLALPLAQFPEITGAEVGQDVTDLIPGLTKWDPPLPPELAGQALGLFPSQFRKTDEERIQNMPDVLGVVGDWTATEKIDGTSCSVIVLDGEDHVASRNLDLTYNPDNTLWSLARTHGLHDRLRESYPGASAAIQGEVFGSGIQGNPLHLKDQRFAAFTIQVNGMAVPRVSWPAWALELSVPVHELSYPTTLDEALAQADKRPSLVPGAQGNIEGIVWRRADDESLPDGRRASWKAISQKYLLAHDR